MKKNIYKIIIKRTLVEIYIAKQKIKKKQSKKI